MRGSTVSRWKYRRPAMFLAVSRYVASQLVSAGIEESRITVVYDGVPVPAEAATGQEILVPWTADPCAVRGLPSFRHA